MNGFCLITQNPHLKRNETSIYENRTIRWSTYVSSEAFNFKVSTLKHCALSVPITVLSGLAKIYISLVIQCINVEFDQIWSNMNSVGSDRSSFLYCDISHV